MTESDVDEGIRNSFVLSCDMAHSVHPNYSSFHQVNHRPTINSGIVLKINCNGRYTSDAVTSAYLKSVAEKSSIPI